MRPKIRVALLVGVTLTVGSTLGATLDPAAPGKEIKQAAAVNVQSPDDIRGIKWRQVHRGTAADSFGVRFDTQGLSYPTAAAALRNNGFRTVILRVPNMGVLRPGTPKVERDNDIIRMLKASELINRARQNNVTALQGVTPIETNLNNSQEVRERALYIARGINAAVHGGRHKESDRSLRVHL